MHNMLKLFPEKEIILCPLFVSLSDFSFFVLLPSAVGFV